MHWLTTYRGTEVESIASFLGREISYALSNQCGMRPEWERFGDSVPPRQTCVLRYSSDSLWKKGCGKLALLDSDLRERLLSSKNDVSQLSSADTEKLQELGILIEQAETQETPIFDKHVAQVFQHDNRLVTDTFSLIQKYHPHDLRKLTALVSPNQEISLNAFLSTIPFDDQNAMEDCFFNYLTNWRDNHPGEQNVPLSYLYAITRAINKRFSHEILSSYCRLPMIGGVSPIPQFLYGKRKLPDETVRAISRCFCEMIYGENLPDNKTLHDQILRETEDKLIKHMI